MSFEVEKTYYSGEQVTGHSQLDLGANLDAQPAAEPENHAAPIEHKRFSRKQKISATIAALALAAAGTASAFILKGGGRSANHETNKPAASSTGGHKVPAVGNSTQHNTTKPTAPMSTTTAPETSAPNLDMGVNLCDATEVQATMEQIFSNNASCSPGDNRDVNGDYGMVNLNSSIWTVKGLGSINIGLLGPSPTSAEFTPQAVYRNGKIPYETIPSIDGEQCTISKELGPMICFEPSQPGKVIEITDVVASFDFTQQDYLEVAKVTIEAVANG